MPEDLQTQPIVNSFEHELIDRAHETCLPERMTEERKKRMTVFPECLDVLPLFYPAVKKAKS